MSYLIGWGIVAAIAGAVVLLLRKVGAPGEGVPPPAAGSCCSAPPEPPGAKPARRRGRA